MNIQFDSASLTKTEAQGLIVLLSALYSGQIETHTAAPVPAPTNIHEQLKAGVDQTPAEPVPAGLVLVEPVTGPAVKRTRRTKAQIAADEAARTPTVGDQLAAAEAARKATAEAAVNGAAEVVSENELRSLLNGYIQKHSMEEAIEKMRAFDCNRVTEAMALDAGKLHELVAALHG